MTEPTRSEVLRRFFAAYLDSKVKADGQVEGFDRWWATSTKPVRDIVWVQAHRACERVIRGLENETDVIVEAVRTARESLRLYVPAATLDPERAKEVVRCAVRAVIDP